MAASLQRSLVRHLHRVSFALNFAYILILRFGGKRSHMQWPLYYEGLCAFAKCVQRFGK
jgi:hypothetical protein